MISKNEIKRIRSLHRKKGRRQEGAFIVEGKKGVEEVLRSAFHVETVFKSSEGGPLESAINPVTVTTKEMKSISALTTPSDHLAVVKLPVVGELSKLDLTKEKVLMLDDLSDPGNLGTILRTADWFGLRTVLLSERCVDAFNPKVVQATMGSIFRMDLHYVDLERWLTEMKQSDPAYPVIAAVMDGGNLDPLEKLDRGALIIGSESHGVSESLLEFVDQKLTIPGGGGAESLNASVAAGILMHRWMR